MKDGAISIGYLAHRTGVAVSALRYYDELGLIHAARGPGNQRRFERAVIRRVSFILAAQKFGYTLNHIKSLLAGLPKERAPDAEDWARISTQFRRDLDAEIANLTRLRDRLDGCIGCGCLSLATCCIYNPDDKAAKEGTGAQYLTSDPGDKE